MVVLPRLRYGKDKFFSGLSRELDWAYYKLLCKLRGHSYVEGRLDVCLFKDGKQVSDVVSARVDSFVRNYYNILAQKMLQVRPSTYSMGGYGVGSLTTKSVSGNSYTTQISLDLMYSSEPNLESLSEYTGARGESGSTARGIVFDSSDTAYSFEQTSAVSLIVNGTSSGCLQYGDTLLPVTNYNSGIFTCTWERYALNATTDQSDVVVRAICLYGKFSDSSDYYTFMVARDVLPTAITVPYGYQIRGRYILYHDRSS